MVHEPLNIASVFRQTSAIMMEMAGSFRIGTWKPIPDGANMADHTLEEIVAAEKEVQAQLAEERRQASEWLAGEHKVISRETEVQLDEARWQCRQKIAAAEAEAGDKVCELVRRAEAYAFRLQNLPEERLRAQVSGHLRRLLPEKHP